MTVIKWQEKEGMVMALAADTGEIVKQYEPVGLGLTSTSLLECLKSAPITLQNRILQAPKGTGCRKE